MPGSPTRNKEEEILPSVSSKNKNKRTNRRASHVGTGNVDDGTVSSKQSTSTAKSDSTKTTEKSRKSRNKDSEPSFAAFEDSAAIFGGDAFFQDTNFTSFSPAETSFANTTSLTLDENNKTFEDFKGGFDAFDPTPAFSQPAEPEWDKSPHTNVPTVKKSSTIPTLTTNDRLHRKFLTDPVHDSASGNVLLATERPDESIWIESVDPISLTLESSFPLLTSELRQKVAEKYKSTLTKIHKIWCMTTGSGQVAIMLDAKVLGSSSLRLIVGYEIPSGRVDYVLTPPSGGDFVYNIATLAIAKKLIFLAGASPKGACVFLCRPAVRESWSANFLSGEAVQVTALAASIHQPWLVIGLTDQSVTVWMYNSSTTSKRWLLPMCRLNREPVQDAEIMSVPGVDNETNKTPEVGFATSICWYQPNSNSLPLLSVAFENAVAIYSVQLPVVATGGHFQALPLPTPTTVVASTPMLEPLSMLRLGSTSTILQCGWLSFEHLVVMTQPSSAVLVYEVQWAPYRPLQQQTTIPMALLTHDASNAPTALIHCEKAVCGVKEGEIYRMELVGHQKVEHPVCSVPAGLDSLGDPLFTDTTTDMDGVLHVVRNAFCERHKKEDDLFYWSFPSKRYWLCRTMVGEAKDASVGEDTKQGFPEEVAWSANSDVLCELTQYGEPNDIVRCIGHPVCVITYHGKDDMTLVDFGNESALTIKVIKGRSLVFFPRAGEVVGLLLGATGTELTYFQWSKGNEVRYSSTYRPIVGVDADEDYIECRSLALFSEGLEKVSLAAIGERARDGRECFISGDPCDLDALQPENWSKILTNIVTGRTFWLKESESFQSILGLQGDGNGYRNFAVTTSSRVMILSSALTKAAESQGPIANNCLAPIGSFAVCYAKGRDVCYLSCVDEEPSDEKVSIASIPHVDLFLLAVRPDRIILFPNNRGLSFESGPNLDNFNLPMAVLRPALVLEPLVANAVCAGQHGTANPFLRKVIERFGRMKAALAHGEAEGIGNIGVGLSSKLFSMLKTFKLHDASSWVLTGTAKFERSSNTKVLPPWLPMGPKSIGGRNADGTLHILSYGDSYLADYVKSSEPDVAATLPRRTDPTSTICRDAAVSALERRESNSAIKLLDFSGSDSADFKALQLVLQHNNGHNNGNADILKALGGLDGHSLGTNPSVSVMASLSRVAATLRSKESTESALGLAPSIQRFQTSRRSRQKIIRETVIASTFPTERRDEDPEWNLACPEAKHFWNEGPNRRKENLLMLDRIGDWLGQCSPLILGAEGADAAADRGTKTLADILNKADDTFAAEPDDLGSVKDDGWLDGVGEGRSDEANLSAYFRMSDGDGEESLWKSEGLIDLSPYENRGLIVGDPNHFSLQPSTSSVDEGEPGKVKSLFDLVFEKSGVGSGSGLTIPAKRGGSLDVGLLQGKSRESRKKCSIEFWYFLPSVEEAARDFVLMRRTFGPSGNILPKICNASDKSCVLWEVLLLKNGELEFHSCSGSSMKSSQNVDPEPQHGDEGEDEKNCSHLATVGRWNHICITFNSKGLESTNCKVSMYMKGKEVASTTDAFLPPGLAIEDAENESMLNDVMQKSHLVFGLDHRAGFRLTEIRVWACERGGDDISSFLYEYLNAAEQKKKFKVKIANKNKTGLLLGKGFGLSQTKSIANRNPAKQQTVSLAPKQAISLSLAPPPKKVAKNPESVSKESSEQKSASSFESQSFFQQPAIPATVEEEEDEGDSSGEDESASLWDTALPLSQQLRPSAAAALIRGPPATRHYGGNRGGLPDFSLLDRIGVGGIGICGSEKTVVFRDNEDPPAATYPIGASGAVVSDQMDDEGSEFLCCFIAKEGRMVVFELRSRTVVVELQMTTKLNFWRYLPPEAAMNTLCFMLVTPVGGFHWMPLEETPRPHQVWKRGPELQGKKVVNYEEGGSNGLDGCEILSSVGLVLATRGSSRSALEGWLLPITGDSKARQVSDDMLGACLCQPITEVDGFFLPWLVTVHHIENAIWVNVLTITEPKKGSVGIGEVRATQMIDDNEVDGVEFEPPMLAMGTFPEALCVSLSNIVVVILRRKGLVAAFELEEEELNLIAQECVDHFVVDAVMRYSAEVGGAEIVMLLADDTNPKDGRIVSFCFRSTT